MTNIEKIEKFILLDNDIQIEKWKDGFRVDAYCNIDGANSPCGVAIGLDLIETMAEAIGNYYGTNSK